MIQLTKTKRCFWYDSPSPELMMTQFIAFIDISLDYWQANGNGCYVADFPRETSEATRNERKWEVCGLQFILQSIIYATNISFQHKIEGFESYLEIIRRPRKKEVACCRQANRARIVYIQHTYCNPYDRYVPANLEFGSLAGGCIWQTLLPLISLQMCQGSSNGRCRCP